MNAMKGPKIDYSDWSRFYRTCMNGDPMKLLVNIPREDWDDKSDGGNTLLHLACMNANVATAVVLLKSGLVDVNVRNACGITPINWAFTWKRYNILEVLCAAGADLRTRDFRRDALIDHVIMDADMDDDGKTARFLVANGVRLSTVREDHRHFITPELMAFESGVLRCRLAVVAMLRVKQTGKLWRWDKFLLKEIAFAVWSTRYDTKWQN